MAGTMILSPPLPKLRFVSVHLEDGGAGNPAVELPGVHSARASEQQVGRGPGVGHAPLARVETVSQGHGTGQGPRLGCRCNHNTQ